MEDSYMRNITWINGTGSIYFTGYSENHDMAQIELKQRNKNSSLNNYKDEYKCKIR